MLQTLSEYGVTTLYDAGTKEFADTVYAFLATLERSGELPLRYEGTYRISTPDRTKIAVAEMKRLAIAGQEAGVMAQLDAHEHEHDHDHDEAGGCCG